MTCACAYIFVSRCTARHFIWCVLVLVVGSRFASVKMDSEACLLYVKGSISARLMAVLCALVEVCLRRSACSWFAFFFNVYIDKEALAVKCQTKGSLVCRKAVLFSSFLSVCRASSP